MLKFATSKVRSVVSSVRVFSWVVTARPSICGSMEERFIWTNLSDFILELPLIAIKMVKDG